MIRVLYEPTSLLIDITDGANNSSVSFAGVIGFRVLDEGDLLDFWPDCSSKPSSVFEIHEGGWLAQESERSGFYSNETKARFIREFFVTGQNECVNVFALQAPHIVLNPR